MRYDRFTERAEAAIKKAQEAAQELGHSYVGTEHLLLGIVRESNGQGAKTLRNNGLTDRFLTELVEKYVGRGEPAYPAQGLTPRAKRVIELAIADAARLGHNFVGTEHLLMGILREPDSAAGRIISGTGLDLNKMYNEILRTFGRGIPMSGPTRTASRPMAAAGARSAPRRHDTRTLDQFSRDLSDLAAKGSLDPVIGRDTEIRRVIQILTRRTKNNPVLIGEPGVGKTAVAEGLAQHLAMGDAPDDLRDKRVVALDLTSMLAGTRYRGDFEERIKNVLQEVLRAGNILLFIDELHTIIGAGAAEGAMDASNILKPALSRGEVQIIGATTLDEYRKHVEKDAALERRFQPVRVEEPSAEESVEILKGLRDKYEAHHKLKITDDAIEASVRLSVRYVTDRFLPDKAIDLVDEACSAVRLEKLTPPEEITEMEARIASLDSEKLSAVKAQDFESAARMRDREGTLRRELEGLRSKWNLSTSGHRTAVTAEDIAGVVASWTGIPVKSLTEDESTRLLRMEETLHRRVVGQDEAVTAVSRAVRRGRVGLKDPKRPVGSFLFLGPTGVGKTELCKALAEAVFGDENAIIRMDMSEFMEKHTVSKLIGSPPGYVGYDEGGQLTEKLRRKPYSVLLFDEIEKAHEDIFNLMLQIMDDGRLTDAQGRLVDFRNAIIVMTSNIGARSITDEGKSLGFGSATLPDADKKDAEIKKQVLTELRRAFKPEFLNRVDETIVFRRLKEEDLREIARKLTDSVALRLKDLGVRLEVTEEAAALLAKKGYDPTYGARPLRKTIRDELEDAIAEKLLDGSLKSGGSVNVTAKDDAIVLETDSDAIAVQD